MLLVFLTLVIIAGVILAVVGWLVSTYNSVVVLKNQVDNAWHQIDVELNRRSDLVPRLVETVKGYVKHEHETLTQVIQARAGLNTANGLKEKNEADNILTHALKSLFAVAENYPDLKADQSFLSFQQELTVTENRLNMVRQQYNDAVLHYNSGVQVFPANLIVGIWGFKQKEYFEVEESAKEAPVVNF
jgi:LemA protein